MRKGKLKEKHFGNHRDILLEKRLKIMKLIIFMALMGIIEIILLFKDMQSTLNFMAFMDIKQMAGIFIDIIPIMLIGGHIFGDFLECS